MTAGPSRVRTPDRPPGGRGRPDTMTGLLHAAYAAYARSPALISTTGSVDFRELGQRASAGASGLAALGVARGDRVVLALDDSLDLVVADHAIWLAGAVRVCLGGRVHGRELERVVRDCRPRLVVCQTRHAAQAGGSLAAAFPAGAVLDVVPDPSAPGHPGVPGRWSDAAAQAASRDRGRRGPAATPGPGGGATVGPDDPAALMYTSGTTGAPRGAVATHRAWAAMTGELASLLPDLGPGDVYGHLAPMSHLSGSVAHALLLRGVAAVLPPPEATRSATVFARYSISVSTVVPTQLRRLVDSVAPGPDVPVPGVLRGPGTRPRALVHGGSAAGADLVQRARAVFGDVVHQVYGSSEAMVPLTWLSPGDLAQDRLGSRAGSAGRATGVCRLEIRLPGGAPAATGERGEVVVSGPTVSPGYRRPDGTVAAVADVAGWYATGDVGAVDADGYLTLTGRAREVIKSGGFSVHPGEVEAAVLALPEVAQCVVCAVPNERWGEGVGAVVQLRPGAVLDARTVVDACRDRLAAHKKPVLVEFVERLPETTTGKVDRSAVRARFWAGRSRSIGTG